MSLLGLPIELLLLIHSELYDDDVLSHVCFLKLSSQTARVYGMLAEDYWELLCRKSGLGLFAHEIRGPMAYKAAAVECAEHAWTCQHPACGRDRLNRAVWERDRIIAWDYDPLHIVREGEDIWPLANDIFSCITFRGNDAQTQCRAYLTGLKGEVDGLTAADALERHPTAARLLATFPPSEVVTFGTIEGVPPARNTNGVTVADAIDSIRTVMFRAPTANDLSTWMEFCVSSASMRGPNVFPWSWSIPELLDTVPSVLAWFTLVRWVGLDYAPDCENGDQSLSFAPRRLPCDPGRFLQQIQDPQDEEWLNGREH